MSFLTDLRERLRALFWRRRLDRELEEELRFHLEQAEEAARSAGLPREEARRQALVAFGGVSRWHEAARDARGLRALDDLVADLRYSLRGLRRSPGFTLTVVTVLGLGVGASAAVLRVADRLLLARLPYPEAERLVQVKQQNSPANLFNLSLVDVQAILAEQQVFQSFGAVRARQATVAGPLAAERVGAGWATAGFFAALEIQPAAGRLPVAADEAAGAPPLAVVSARFAEARLGGIEAAPGKSVVIDDVSHTVIGVLPRRMTVLAGVPGDLWPVAGRAVPTRRGPFMYWAVGRLRDGVTMDGVARDLSGISQRLFPAWASNFQDSTARLTPVPLRQALVGAADHRLAVFGGAVLLVLLVALANVASLLLVRAATRSGEMAVRAALGASRARLGRLVVTEGTLLGLMAGGLALAVTHLLLGFAELLAPELAGIGSATLNGPTAGLALAMASLAGIAAGLIAAPLALGHGTDQLRGDARRVGTGRSTHRARGLLVTVEFALALPLLLGAGLLLKTVVRLSQVDPGFDPSGLASVSIALPRTRYPDAASVLAFWRRLEDRIGADPIISTSGLVSALPPDNPGDQNNFDLLAHPVPSGTAQPVSPYSYATRGYFETLGIPLLAGRGFGPGDTAGAPPVALVSRAWASHYLPGQDPIGQQFVSGGCTSCPPVTIVGVVGDVKYLGLAGAGEMAYESATSDGLPFLNLVVRGRSGTGPALAAVRQIIASLDPALAVDGVTLRARLEDALGPQRLSAIVLGAFAAVSLALAAIGVFGLMSYVVRQRRREIGVRLALGASPRSVRAMVLTSGLRHVAWGGLAGLMLALLGAGFLKSYLFEVNPTDPGLIASVVLILSVAAVAACWLPGRSAARIPPLEAIQCE